MKYDFENDNWPDDARVPYHLILWWFFKSVYGCCCTSVHYNNRWHNLPLEPLSEYTTAHAQSEGFSLPIEQLMLEVITLMVYAGRASEKNESAHRQAIAEILRKHDLETMLAELPADERREFVEDMRTLQLDVPANC